MSRKNKFHTFHILYRLFAYLADKSGGWRVFVAPKLLFGSLIVGWGLIVADKADAQNRSENERRNRVLLADIKDTLKHEEIDDKVYCYVTEQNPQFPGGDKALLDFINKNLKYPESAIKADIHGKVMLRFVITITGEVEKVEIIRSLQPDCDKEAIRIIKLLPKFIPGKQSGKPVSVWYNLPVTFKMPK